MVQIYVELNMYSFTRSSAGDGHVVSLSDPVDNLKKKNDENI